MSSDRSSSRSPFPLYPGKGEVVPSLMVGSSSPVAWDADHVCAWPECGCCEDSVCAKRMAALLSPHGYRPGAVHMRSADGWVSPYEAGDPRCPLSGIDREREEPYPGMVWGLVFGLLALVVFALGTVGLGYALWTVLWMIEELAR